jgi:hypothetical protein
MKHGRIGNESSLREAPQIRTLISDLDRIVQILNCDIAAEEERVRVFDRSDVTYPLLAGTLAARRDNLRDTIACLNTTLRRSKHHRSNLSRRSVPRPDAPKHNA